MLEFLNLLSDGIPLDLKLKKSSKSLLRTLLSYEAIEICENVYKLKEKFCIGEITFIYKGRGIVSPIPKTQLDWIILPSLLQGSQKGDIVLIKRLKRQKGGQIAARVIGILETKGSNVLCYLEKYQLDCMAISIPDEIPYKIKASQKSLKTLPTNTILKLDSKSGEILEVLGALEDPKIDETITLSLYQRHKNFSIAAQLEAESFKAVRLRDFKERVDCTHLPFCTIDPESAKDHDDAVFFDSEHSILYVAIADVSYYVPLDSMLDLEARERGFSIYFPHLCIPMLPSVLSENLCSLTAGNLRLAMVWKIRLHRRTNVVLQSELFEAVIKVRQKLSYEVVDTFFNTQKSRVIKVTLKPMLNALNTLAQKLRKKRLKKGFDFLSDSIKMELNQNLELRNLKVESQSLSHQMIEECMLLANLQSAKLQVAKTKGQFNLGIYRIHEAPSVINIQELFLELRLLGVWKSKNYPKNVVELHQAIASVQATLKGSLAQEVDRLIIRSMQQAMYASYNIGHFGLGFEAYTHFTSPIRRYSDLLLHRILKAKMQLTTPKFLESLPTLCEQLSQKEREITKIELDFKDRKFARFLAHKIGQSFIGVIINSKSPLLVQLTESPLQSARVVCLRGYGVKYQKVRVQIIDVNLITAKIYGKIVESFNECFGLQHLNISDYFFAKASFKKQKYQDKQKETPKKQKRRTKKKPHMRRKKAK